MKHSLLFIFIAFLSSSLSAQILADSSFEASGAGGTTWTSTSAAFGTSFCDAGSCGNCGGPCVPHTGTWYVWFGGTANAEIGTASQTFNAVTSGAGTLFFWLKVPMKGTAGDTLSMLLDGVAQSKIATIDSIGTYINISVNMGQITSGSHNLTFRFQKQASATSVNVLVDDVRLNISGTAGLEEIDFNNGIQISNSAETGKIKVAYNFNELQNLHLTATDITGKVVYKELFEDQATNEQEIESTGWSSGIYTITLTSDKGLTKTTKVVVY
jgi:Protein of unknown function (DUF3244).